MADTKLSALTADAAPTGDDLLYLVDDAAGTPTSKKATLANTLKGGLGFTALGDLVHGGASGAVTKLAGNTTTTKKYLAQTGDGVASAAPAWSQPAATELSDYVSTAEANLPSAAVWTGGTVPGLSGDVYERYRYNQIGKMVTLTIYLKYSVAGATCTRVRIVFPSGVPLPVDWTNTVNTEVVLVGEGGFSNATTSLASTTARAFITKDSGSATGYYIYADGNSTSANFAVMNFTYRAQ